MAYKENHILEIWEETGNMNENAETGDESTDEKSDVEKNMETKWGEEEKIWEEWNIQS